MVVGTSFPFRYSVLKNIAIFATYLASSSANFKSKILQSSSPFFDNKAFPDANRMYFNHIYLKIRIKIKPKLKSFCQNGARKFMEESAYDSIVLI